MWLVGHRLEAGAKIKEIVNYVKTHGGPGAELSPLVWKCFFPVSFELKNSQIKKFLLLGLIMWNS